MQKKKARRTYDIDTENISDEDLLTLVRKKYEETGEIPRKSDFTPEEIVALKERFGPWPRVIEAAGLKKSRD